MKKSRNGGRRAKSGSGYSDEYAPASECSAAFCCGGAYHHRRAKRLRRPQGTFCGLCVPADPLRGFSQAISRGRGRAREAGRKFGDGAP